MCGCEVASEECASTHGDTPTLIGPMGVEFAMKKVVVFAVSMLVALSASDAAAQLSAPWTDRGYLNLNVGFESVSGELADATTFSIYDETGTLSVAQPIDSGSFFDLSAGGRVWRNVSIGIGFHQGSTHSEAAVAGSVPHPVFFNRNRPIAFSVGDLSRMERAVHLQFGYMLPVTDRINVHLLVGPSFFKLRQDVVSEIVVAEGPNNDTVTATGTVAERVDSPTGFNIGADVAYTVYQSGPMKVGVGMFLRYSAASADVELIRFTGQAQGHVVDSDVGGLQVGFGGRFRF